MQHAHSRPSPTELASHSDASSHQDALLPELAALKDSGLRTEDVRLAVLHFVELAAAAEERGFVMGETWSTGDEDVRVLSDVVARLLKHRSGQRERQRNAICDLLLDDLAGLYRAVDGTDGNSCPSREDIAEVVRRVPVRATEDEIDKLVIKRNADADADERTITALRGPVEAAKEAVASLVGRSSRTLSTWRSRGLRVAARHAFDRWVAPAVAVKYVGDVHRWYEQALADSERCSLKRLNDPDAEAGHNFDAAALREAWQLQELVAAHPDQWDRSFPVVEQVRHVIAERVAGEVPHLRESAMCLAETPERAEDRLEGSALGPRVRSAVLRVVESAGEGRLPDDADQILADGVRADALESFREQLTGLFGAHPWAHKPCEPISPLRR